MSIFRNIRRIVDLTIQKRLYAPSPTIANKDKQLLNKEELKNNQVIIEEVGYKQYSVVKKDISPQHMTQPRVSSIIAHNHITPRIYYEVANKDEKVLKKRAVQKKSINKGENIDRRYPQNRNECGLKNNITSVQRFPVENVRKPIVYDVIPHNHVIAPNKGKLSKELNANRNQVIYHRIFNVPDVQRQTSFKPLKNVTWYAKTGDGKKGAPKPGRLGKLSSSNETEYFFKTDRERLLELKKKLKDKEKGPDALKKS